MELRATRIITKIENNEDYAIVKERYLSKSKDLERNKNRLDTWYRKELSRLKALAKESGIGV